MRNTCSHCNKVVHGDGLCATHWSRRSLGISLNANTSGPNDRVHGDGLVWVILTNRRGVEQARACIDAADEHMLGAARWSLSKGYVTAMVGGKRMRLHRMLMGVRDPKVTVDHINGLPTDCRRQNLRLTNQAENAQNQVRHGRPPDMRNVYRTRKNSWLVTLTVNKRPHYVGCFQNLDDAKAAAREARARLMPFANEDRHR